MEHESDSHAYICWSTWNSTIEDWKVIRCENLSKTQPKYCHFICNVYENSEVNNLNKRSSSSSES